MSKVTCYPLTVCCDGALDEPHDVRPVTARDHKALESDTNGPLLLKGLMCNHGRTAVLPQSLQQANVRIRKPPMKTISMEVGGTDIAVKRCKPSQAIDTKAYRQMHGWDDKRDKIAMVSAYVQGDHFLPSMHNVVNFT